MAKKSTTTATTKTANNAAKTKQANALDLYLNTDMDQKQICTMLDVSQQTFTKWKKEGNWEELKGAETITASKIRSQLLMKMHELSTADKIDADKLIKVATAIERISDKKATISQSINVFKDFTTWCIKVNPEKAKEINLLQIQYVNMLVNGE